MSEVCGVTASSHNGGEQSLFESLKALKNDLIFHGPIFVGTTLHFTLL